ncbi:MAG: FecR domain-containing protein [Armatimonadetes bacterium]|nr:FecR domain-containing protein [Armatimonadota bacterium]
MKRLAPVFGILTTVLVLAALALADPMELAGSTAAIAYVENSVQIKGSGGWTRADVGDVLAPGSRIKTGKGSTAALVLSDETMIKLAENTEFVLVDLRESENGNFVRKFQLTLGRVWADVTPSKSSGSTFEIQGPDAVAAVRGTAFEVDATDTGTEINVFEGKVESTDAFDGASTMLAADLETNSFQALRGRKGKPRRFDVARADAWQQWNMKNRKQMQEIFRKAKMGKLTPEKVRQMKAYFRQLPPPAQQRLRQSIQGKRPPNGTAPLRNRPRPEGHRPPPGGVTRPVPSGYRK